MSYFPPQPHQVLQGDFHVTGAKREIMTSMLGSCVSACIRDTSIRVGGMNHFLLPGQDRRDLGNLRYGETCMQAMIQALLAKGATHQNLEIWLFGGASVLEGETGVGAANCAWAEAFVQTHGISLSGCDLGGQRGRRVTFAPYSGQTTVSLIPLPQKDQPIPSDGGIDRRRHAVN